MATIVAVVDSGFNLQHQDLAPKLWRNQREIAGNGRDDDGNGFVDDVNGVDLITGQALSSDPNGHGTHCAGIVASTEPSVELMGLRVLDASGSGSFSDAIKAWSYALTNGARVINNSWGGPIDPRNLPALRDVVDIGQRRFGAVFVAAAGNESVNTDQVPHSPSGLDGVLSVGASDNGGQRAPFSNFGASTVDLFAPGVEILSADAFSNTGRVRFSGTSMAAPIVAGAVARFVNRDPSSSTEKLKASVLNSVVRRSDLQGKAVTGGVLANEFTQAFTSPLQAQSGGGPAAAALANPRGPSSARAASLKAASDALPGKLICVLKDFVSRKQVAAAIGSNQNTVDLEWPEAFDNRICILTYTPGLNPKTVLRKMKSTSLFKSVQEDFQIQATALPLAAAGADALSDAPLPGAAASRPGEDGFAFAGLQAPAWISGDAASSLGASLGLAL